MFANFLKARAEKHLGEAIERHDLAAMEGYLKRGAQKIDHIVWREGDRPGEKVPASKFTDPVSLAKYVGMTPAGMSMLSRYGLNDSEAAPVRAPQR